MRNPAACSVSEREGMGAQVSQRLETPPLSPEISPHQRLGRQIQLAAQFLRLRASTLSSLPFSSFHLNDASVVHLTKQNIEGLGFCCWLRLCEARAGFDWSSL